MPKEQEKTYTRVDDNVVVCDDCGAYARTESEVQHYPGCKTGESKMWEEHYNRFWNEYGKEVTNAQDKR